MWIKAAVFFMDVLQVQKIRKALEKVGKEFEFKDIRALKVPKYFTVTDCDKCSYGVLTRNVCSRLGLWRSSKVRSGE